MKIPLRERIGNAIAGKATNSMSVPLGEQFLRYGNRSMVSDWSQVVMNDRDIYTGLMYAAIRNRANRVAQIAEENIRTDATKDILEKAKKAKVDVIHPYLQAIDDSKSFSNYAFWSTISTFLDLRGVYYLMVIRTAIPGRVGTVQEFKLLNPYNVQRVKSDDGLTVIGYKETRGGYSREISPSMIIPIQDLNPFSEDDPFSLADAARDQQFTLKQAGDYTRSTLQNNVNAPGIISTDIVLTPEQMDNFKSRMTGKVKGEPIFTDGAGNVKYNPMTTDLDKAALDKISTMNTETLIAVTGTSKTALGIEVSGVTRDTSKVQSDQLITGQIMPRIQLINDALNQDYKTNYPAEYAKDQYRIYLDSPLGTDREAELNDVAIRQQSYNLFSSLVDDGYDYVLAAKFAAGEIVLEELGEPTNEPNTDLTPSPTRVTITEPADGEAPPEDKAAPPDPEAAEELPTGQSSFKPLHEVVLTADNALDKTGQGKFSMQEAQLRNAVVNVEEQIVTAVMNKVTRNAYTSQSDIIDQKDRNDLEHELELAIAAFYGVVLPLYGSTVSKSRMAQYNLPAQFTVTSAIKAYIAANATKAAQSHMNTVLNDLLKTVQEANLSGAADPAMIQALRTEYSQITTKRAETLARNEANRAFNQARFDADKQFLQENDLMSQAYKTWVCGGSDPCPFCESQSLQGPIPFDDAFGELGDTWTANVVGADGVSTVKSMSIDYEVIDSGMAHVNCQCYYELTVDGL